MKSMKGIEYLVTGKGKRKFVQIDLSIHGKAWEDFIDVFICSQRKNEKRVSLESVLKKINKLKSK